jgi:uncharacterized protein (DUF1778 family)
MPYTLMMATAPATKRRQRQTARGSSRRARLEVRITEAQKALIERAAAYQGRTVSDFVVSTLASAAENVIHDHEIIRLNAAQSLAFAKALLDPPAPNAALRRAARKFRRTVESG